LPTAIGSVLGQTYQDFELCVWDNASDDDTAKIVASFHDPRIHYTRNNTNIGPAANWIRAVEGARGPYCTIFADDDFLHPAFLERLVAPLEADQNIDIAFCDHWLVDVDGIRLVSETDRFSRGYGRATLRQGCHRPFRSLVLLDQAILINAALIRGARLAQAGALGDRSTTVLDYYMLGRLAELGGGAFYVGERLYSRRQHAGSGTSRLALEIWPDLQRACADLYHGTLSTESIEAIRRKWAQTIVSEAVMWVRLRAWRRVPGRLARTFRLIPPSSLWGVTLLVIVDVLRRALVKAPALAHTSKAP